MCYCVYILSCLVKTLIELIYGHAIHKINFIWGCGQSHLHIYG
jgi:hypothetical protein